MQEWQYDAVGADTETLNKLGAEGWEVITITTDQQRDGYGNSWNVYTAWLKRLASSEGSTS
jgi:hypothetical protein